MRPATLAEVADRLSRAEALEAALPEFLDEFYKAPDEKTAAEMLRDEPTLTGKARDDALLGAVADYLSMQYLRVSAPAWARAPERILREPFFTASVDTPAIKAFLVHSSPAEFKAHNIFTEAVPLRRKMSDRPRWRNGRKAP